MGTTSTVKTRLLGFFVVLARGLYAVFTAFPVQDKVTFVSRQQNFTSIDFELLAEGVHRQSPSTTIVILNHPVNPKLLYPFKVCVEMFHIATSRAVVVDSYNIVVSVFTHKPHLRIFQIWHALGAFKAFGLKAVDTAEGSSRAVASVMHMHQNYTFVTAASAATGKTFQECFGVSAEQILVAGSPRVDYLGDRELQLAQRDALRTKYDIDAERTVVLFAPTFRKGQAIPLDELVSVFDFNRYTLVFRKHPLDDKTVITDSRVIVPDEREGFELLAVADHLVTDYSAIAFEATLLDMPIHFWAFDLDAYSVNRGFAIDFVEEAPGPILATAGEVIASIGSTTGVGAKYRAFQEKYIETGGFNNVDAIVGEIVKESRVIRS